MKNKRLYLFSGEQSKAFFKTVSSMGVIEISLFELYVLVVVPITVFPLTSVFPCFTEKLGVS